MRKLEARLSFGRCFRNYEMHRFFAPPTNFGSDAVNLDADETRHLRDVLRLKAGENVSVFDGNGSEFLCVISEIGKKHTLLSITSKTEPSSPESPCEITLAATVLNGDKYDLVIQKSVELGVTKLIPLQTIRGDVKVSDAAKRLVRWRRIAMEATKQCGRARLMEVGEPMSFQDLVTDLDGGHAVIFSERDGAGFDRIEAGKKITAFIGPKGGWDDQELRLARDRGFGVITLGGRILRAETASIALVALLQHRYGDLN